MNAKAVGLASGENSHQYLLLLFGINTEGILLSCRTVKIVDNKVFHLIWVLADNGTDFSQVQAFNGTVYNGTFQDHSQDTVKSGLCTVKISGDQYDSRSLTRRARPISRLVYLCRIMAAISVPPVEAPTLNTMAAPTAGRITAKHSSRNTSCVSGKLSG